MCAVCGSVGKYGQNQPEAIKKDRERLNRVQAAMAAKAKERNGG